MPNSARPPRSRPHHPAPEPSADASSPPSGRAERSGRIGADRLKRAPEPTTSPSQRQAGRRGQGYGGEFEQRGEPRAPLKRPVRYSALGDFRRRQVSEAELARPDVIRAPAAGSAAARDDERHGFPPPRPAAQVEQDPNAPVRISKLLAERGLCSRREADSYIERGWVLLDGVRVTELGTRAFRHQSLQLAHQASATQAQRATILLHKPVGFVSGQAEDGYPPAASLVQAQNRWEEDRDPRDFSPQVHEGLAPAGRLDIDSTGLLVLTQDGRVARQLIGDDASIDKEYLVRVVDQYGNPIAESQAERYRLALLSGLVLDGVALKPFQVSWQNEDQLRFVLREGRKRQIRRMCEQVGLYVVGLKRVRIGRVMLGHLPQGAWRYLTADEAF